MSAILGLQNQPTPFLNLAPYCWAAMCFQIRQDYSTEVEATINCLVYMHLQAFYTYLSLGFCFDHEDVALKSLGHFFCQLVEENWEGDYCLLMQNKCGGCVLFYDVQKPPKWVGQDTMEAAKVLQRNLNQTLLDLNALGSTHSFHHLENLYFCL